MNPDTTHLILGPPGTGKTYELLEVTDSLLESGVPADQIAFVAFTRKAANEARSRACEKFGFTPDQLPWFRTLHSFAFHQMGLSKNQVMGFADYVKLAQLCGVYISFKGVHEDGTIIGLTKGDRLFFMENMARAQLMDLRLYWTTHPDDEIYWYELERLKATLVEYKRINGKLDFTDMMTAFNRTPAVPKLQALIVDEAQDLTPLQWQCVEHLAEDVEETYIAGDDDQAIFKWAGADVDKILKMPGTRRVLPQSYRVPVIIQGLAEKVVANITTRIPKHWLPTKEQGVLTYETDVQNIDMGEGSWLLLARNVYLLKQYNDYCIQQGYVFDSHLGSPVRGSVMMAIRYWEELRKGRQIDTIKARCIYDLITPRVGVQYGFKAKLDKCSDEVMHNLKSLKDNWGLATEEVWHVALDKIPAEEREYFISALRRGEKLLKEPRIRIETIHGVKGGEADHVVICTDMAERTYREYELDPDSEARVWYVAVTRAKKSLHILNPQTNKCYDL